jgi:3-phenylpropionate/trans-cinnamate dioxygenase ferredoxin reductase subunit
MTGTDDRVLIIGGGLAGANAAFELRERGYEGDVTIVAEEDEWPYERPPVSKQYLRGEQPLATGYVRQPDEYAANRIELLRGVRATALDVTAGHVATTAGTLPFRAVVLATGAAPRRLDVTGADLEGIHYIRDAADADELRAAAATAERVVVVGGGWLGAEVAASLRQLGAAVTFLTARPRPLEHVLGPEVADIYRALHVENGVRFESGRVESFEGDARVEHVRLADGRTLATDLVVVGIGAIPRAALAADAGLTLADGAVRVDEFLRSSAPDVYAIGDIATAWNPRYRSYLHLEHWDNAIRQGKAAAANITGAQEPFDRVPYFYSDQYDVGMEYRGHAPTWDEVVIRGDLARREFHAFWLVRGRVAAAMNVNLWDDGDALQTLVELAQPVDVRRLADPHVPLLEVTREPVTA